MLDQLLRLKQHREERAELDVVKGRASLSEAAGAESNAVGALAIYRAWRVSEERTMYDAICQRVVLPRELVHLREDVQDLRRGEQEKEQALVEARKRRGEAERMLEQYRQHHAVAVRTSEKYVQLNEGVRSEMAIEAERNEETEIEDSYTSRTDADKENHNE